MADEIKTLNENIDHLSRDVANVTSRFKVWEELKDDLTPLAKEIFNDFVEKLDKLEKDGVFESIKALLEVVAKFQRSFSAQDIANMGDGLIRLAAIMSRFTKPENLDKLEQMVDTIETYDFGQQEKVSLFKLLKRARRPEVLRGFNHVLNLITLMGQNNKQNQGGQYGTTRVRR